MAGKNVELGTVGFNLEANDASLDGSLAKLRQFGEAVNKASNATDETGKKAYSSMVRVEKVLTSAFDRVSALTENMKRLGDTDEAIARLTSQYDRLVTAAIKAGRAFESHEQVRATVGLGAATAQATRAIREQASATSLLEAKQNALVSTWERVANASSRMKMRGAADADLAKYNDLLVNFQNQVNASDLTTLSLAAAQRQFNMALGETNRELRENLNAAQMAERQQSRLIQATRNVAYVNARLMRSNLPGELVNANQGALSNFGNALQGGNAGEVLAAQQRLNDALMSSRLAMAGAEKPVNKMSLAMHDLSKATVLALGPLSGIGSRIAVMTALLDSNSVKVALFIGGAVAAASALYQLTAASIRASMEQEKFDALLITSTGSATLVAKEYEYLLNTSNRMGQSVKGLVKPYADFTSAARLSGMSLDQQRRVFEALSTTGSALRWNQEQLSRAFLATTQMLSKGSVMSEEMKKQLGELIPNVIGLGAAASDTSTKGFMKMMQEGKILTNDFLPKFAELLLKVFGPGAIAGAESLQGKLSVLDNSMFELHKSFDRAVGTSEFFRKAVIASTNVVDFLSKNMTSVIALFAAFAGAGAGLAVVRMLSYLPTLIGSVTSALAFLTSGVTAARVAIMVLESSTIIGWLIRLAGVLTGAALGWKLFKDSADDAAGKQQNINKQIQDWLDLQTKVGSTQKQVRDQMVGQAGERLGLLQKELDAQLAMHAKIEAARNPKEGTPAYDRKKFAENRGDPIPFTEELLASQERLTAIRKEMADLIGMVQKMGQVKLEPDQPPGGEDDKDKRSAWDNWVRRIISSVNTAKGAVAEFNALVNGGESAQNFEKALAKARDVMIDMPKKAGSLEEVSKKLREAGFEGKSVVDQLTVMFLAEEKARDGIRDFGKAAREQKTAVKEVADLFNDLQNRDQAISGNVTSVEDAKNAKKLNDEMDRLRDALAKIGTSEEGITATLQAYADEWTRITDAERHVKEVEKVSRALEQMGVKVGDSTTVIQAQQDKMIALVRRGVELKILTEEAGAQEILRIQTDAFRKLTSKSNEYHDFLRSLTNTIENGLTDVFAGKGEAADKFKQLLDKIWAEVLAFMVKMAVVKPLMKSLFGGDYTGVAGDGPGIFSGLIGNFARIFGSQLVGGGAGYGESGGATEPAVPDAQPRAMGGDVNPFSDYWVGEEGPELLRMGKDGGRILSTSQSKNATSGGGLTYSDQSRNVYNIDARADVASTMRIVAQSHARNNQHIQRMLKVRYG